MVGEGSEGYGRLPYGWRNPWYRQVGKGSGDKSQQDAVVSINYAMIGKK